MVAIEPTDDTGGKLRHAIELRERRLHALPVRHPAGPARDPERIIVAAFAAVAGIWAAAAGIVLMLALADQAPRSITDGRTTVHCAIALSAAAAAALSALLYAIPRRSGAALWSRFLPWVHAILLNAAFIVPAWQWNASRLLPAEEWVHTLVIVSLLHVGWLAALALNLGESLAPLLRRPPQVLPVIVPLVPAPRPAPVVPAAGRASAAPPPVAKGVRA